MFRYVTRFAPGNEKSMKDLRFTAVFLIIPFGPERDEVRGEWRQLHYEELNDPYCSPNIVQLIKYRRMG